jgi:hypothetical protein
VDKPLTVRMVQWQPFVTRKLFDKNAPVCASCKRTNRTRSFCRERNRHRQLPWCTVYVLLTALDQTDPSTLVAAPSQKVESDGEADSLADESKAISRDETSVVGSETIGGDADQDSDDVNDIAESKTFLVKVSSRGSSLHWLDLAEFDPIVPQAAPESYLGAAAPEIPTHMYPPALDSHPSYYGMDYAAAQHQNVLKSHQQYFFQMQQRHHHYHTPGQWPHAMHADSDQDPQTAGQSDRKSTKKHDASHEEAYHALYYQQQQQWASYYAHGHYPPDTTGVHSRVDENADENTVRRPADTNEDTNDDVDSKRQRLV